MFHNKNASSNSLLILMLLVFSIGCNKNSDNASPAIETSTLTDIDGNIYKTVKIGDQWWMAENLKVKTYRNGQQVFGATSNSDFILWDTITSGAYCLYNFNTSTPTGYLYNWYAINDTNNLAPAGWHIPTDAEWKQLEIHLGMSDADANKSGWRGTQEGEMLKQQGLDSWRQYADLWATNESGFSALAGGCRMFNGTDYTNAWSFPLDLQSTGFWWTSTESNDNQVQAWFRYLDYKNSNIFRAHENKNYGFSVRCVKD